MNVQLFLRRTLFISLLALTEDFAVELFNRKPGSVAYYVREVFNAAVDGA
jgi:hypothetical protein